MEDPPISRIVTTSTHLRPSLSPMVPKNNPPSGRARNPTPKVAKLAISAVAGSRLEKNSFEKISADREAVQREVVVLQRAARGAGQGRAAEVGGVLGVVGSTDRRL